MRRARAWTAETIPWEEVAEDGTKYALLEGRRDTPSEVFSYAFYIPAGFWDPPHAHTADARVFVLSGTLYLGYGEVFERSRLEAYPAGSYLLVPAGAHHFDGSEEETLILGTAVGPWATHYVDPDFGGSAGTVASF